MKKISQYTLVWALVISSLFWMTVAFATVLTIPEGGTGVDTLNGLIFGNGTEPFTGITDSAGLAGAISDTTGSGALVFGTNPSFTASILTPSVIGGATASSSLVLQSTSDAGGTRGDIIFKTGNNATTEVMRILNSGLVGIGTANPAAFLHIQGTLSQSADFLKILNSSGTTLLKLDRNGDLSIPGTGSDSLKLGIGAIADGNESIAIGFNAKTGAGTDGGSKSIVIGNNSTAIGLGEVIIGFENTTCQHDCTAVGYRAIGGLHENVAIGGGASAGTSGLENVAIGDDAMVSADSTFNAVTIGRLSRAGTRSSAYGHNARAQGGSSVALGAESLTNSSDSDSIVIGNNATSTGSSQLVIGSTNDPIKTVYIGSGVTSTAPQAVTFSFTDASGTDKPSRDITFQTGRSTGTGAAGQFVFSVATPSGISGSIGNSQTPRFIIGQNLSATTNLIFSSDNMSDIGASGATRPRSGYFATSLVSPALVGGSGTTQALTLKSTSGVGTAGADIIFKTGNNGGTEAARILNSGNVGIGTAAPGSKLDVNGDIRIHSGSGGSLIFADGTSVNSATGLSSATNISNTSDAIITTDSDTNGSGDVVFKTASTDRLHILNNGKTGLGTATPSTKLEVQGGGNNQINTVSTAAGAGTAILASNTAGGAPSSFVGFTESGLIQYANTNGLQLRSYTTMNNFAPSGGQNRLQIDSSGNIGIGTTVPSAKLDINSDSLILEIPKTPTSSSAPCITGTIAWDTNYMYVCTSPNNWKRSVISSW